MLLFVTDRRCPVFHDNFLAVYHDSRQRMYFLNGSHLADIDKGYRYFQSDKKIDAYLARVDRTIENLKSLTQKKQVNRTERSLEDMYRAQRRFIALYAKTEEYRLRRFEQSNAFALLDRLGQSRLRLREAIEDYFAKTLPGFIERLAAATGIPVDDIGFASFEEITERINSPAPLPEIEHRKQGYAIINNAGSSQLFIGDTYQEIVRRLHVRVPRGNLLHGTPAHPGKVRGRVVRIIHDQHARPEIVPGCIVVTENTRPEMVTACRQAAAIITDEGGLASHAAIIAREFKIPTVVGTKYGTHLFANGDYVEVDATNGIVKILSHDAADTQTNR